VVDQGYVNIIVENIDVNYVEVLRCVKIIGVKLEKIINITGFVCLVL
jgi:hypothetical protein